MVNRGVGKYLGNLYLIETNLLALIEQLNHITIENRSRNDSSSQREFFGAF